MAEANLIENLPEPGTISPATGEELAPVDSNTKDDVAAAIKAARAAQVSWGALSLDDRIRAIKKLEAAMLARHKESLPIMASETGRSETECLMSELSFLGPYFKEAIRVSREALRPEKLRISQLEYPGKRGVIEQVARGVIGIIAPWNYPLGNFMKHLLPALLAGNGVVLKPSEHTPRTGAWLHELCEEALPKGLVQLVQGRGDVGAWLLEGGVDGIAFTGSVATGKKVAGRAGELLVPCSVELGGKDAAIVLADCDLNRTALGIAQWAIHNCGQNCAGIERVYVEEAIADKFVEKLGKIVDKLRVSPDDNSDLGPLQNAAQLNIVHNHVEAAKSAGATVVAGGEPTGEGYGYRPTVLDNCSNEMTVVSTETFGPVIAVVRVKDADEGIKLANDSHYGLNGSIWTKDIARGEVLARKLDVGIALVNNHSFTGTMPQAPWTGVKDTGTGIALSRHAYITYARPRTVIVDKASAPDPWWFPANDDLRALGDALIERAQGSLGATFKLLGIVGRRTKAAKELADS